MSKSLVEVILLHDFQKKGKFGSRIKVKRGYAKNFLVVNKLAIYANKENLKKFEDMRINALNESEKSKVIALELAKKIEESNISIIRQSAQDSKIFGTVSSKDISIELQKLGIDVARNKIIISDSIKYLGVYNVKIVLHPDVIIEKQIFIVNSFGSIRNSSREDDIETQDQSSLFSEDSYQNDENQDNSGE